MIPAVTAVNDRRETLADVAEQILRDQLQSVQEELDQIVTLKEQLENDKMNVTKERDVLAQEKAQLETTLQQTKQARILLSNDILILFCTVKFNWIRLGGTAHEKQTNCTVVCGMK